MPKKVQILTPKHFNLKSPKEIGTTFKANSFLKAKFFSKKTKMICLADDSGLEINLLNGAPGIYSARWGGKKKNFNLAIKKVYKELIKKDKFWYKKKQRARFICALTLFWKNNEFFTVRGKVEGFLSRNKKGNNGFGYDPIFIPKNYKYTFGQMKYSKKRKIDHRYRAFKKIKKFF